VVLYLYSPTRLHGAQNELSRGKILRLLSNNSFSINIQDVSRHLSHSYHAICVFLTSVNYSKYTHSAKWIWLR
jgi:hypothetical protein